MLDGLPNILWVDSVPHIEHVRTVTLGAFGVFIREILTHSLQSNNLLVQCFHSNFIIGRWVAESDCIHLQKLLVSLQNCFQMIFGDHIDWWQHILPTTSKIQVMDETQPQRPTP